MRNIVRIKGLSKRFGKQLALKDVNICLPERGLIGILGQSGSGKTTLLNIISGLCGDYSGSCKILGKELRHLSEEKRREYRLRNVGYVFQSFRLLELDSALSNVMMPLDALYKGSMQKKTRKALDLLSFVGMESKAHAQVNKCSGGEKQRIAFARAMANDPDLLVCDEPTGALDEENANSIFSLMKRIASKRLVIVVSHDAELIDKYCEHVLRIKDGVVSEGDWKESDAGDPPNSFLVDTLKDEPSLSWRYLIRHAWNCIKSRRWRSILSEISISMGLIGMGLSLYVGESIGEQIGSVFEQMVPSNTINVTPRNASSNPIGNVYAASMADSEYIYEYFQDEIFDFGCSYIADFESIFCDANTLYIPLGSREIILPSFSIRSVNDYKWLDLYPELNVYPRRPEEMREDEVVLGLPYASMNNLCYSLGILRNFEALGNYILNKGMTIVFDLAHREWGYEDQQILKVVGVISSHTPCMYSTRHRWAREFFVDSMRFTGSDTVIKNLPSALYEIYFLEPRRDMSSLLRLLRHEPIMNRFVFERPTYEYFPTIYGPGDEMDCTRLYIYSADKSGVSFPDLDLIKRSSDRIRSMNICTYGGYNCFSGSMFSGFAYKFFIGGGSEEIDQVIDTYSYLKKEDSDLLAELPEKVYSAYYADASSGGCKYSSDIPVLVRGRKPVGVEEIVLSESLYESLEKPKEVVIGAEISSKEIGDYLSRDFKKATLKVVGVAEGDTCVFYGGEEWSVDFFLECLSMSSFLLEPNGAVLYLDDAECVEETISLLQKEFPSYSFENPAEQIASTVGETTGLISKILFAFSLLSSVISMLLFSLVMSITVSESKRESELFSIIGLSSSDILKGFVCHCLIYGFLAFSMTFVSLSFIQVVSGYYIADAFGVKYRFSYSWKPVLSCLVLLVLFEAAVISILSLRKKMN